MLQPKEKGPQIEPLKTLSLLVGVERFELPTPCSQNVGFDGVIFFAFLCITQFPLIL